MALSNKTQNRLTWGVRIVLALAFEAIGAIVLGLLCALVVWHQRPTQFRQI